MSEAEARQSALFKRDLERLRDHLIAHCHKTAKPRSTPDLLALNRSLADAEARSRWLVVAAQGISDEGDIRAEVPGADDGSVAGSDSNGDGDDDSDEVIVLFAEQQLRIGVEMKASVGRRNRALMDPVLSGITVRSFLKNAKSHGADRERLLRIAARPSLRADVRLLLQQAAEVYPGD